MMSLVQQAAANNAAWCDVVARTHGIETRTDADAWTSLTRTPPLYPDAVVLSPAADAGDLLDRVDSSEGCSLKDSFACLGLDSAGFDVLFDAHWIALTPAAERATRLGPAWTVVRDPDHFATWERAWRDDDGPADVLRTALLRDPLTTVLSAGDDDHVTAGCVLTASADVIGVSNFFAPPSMSRDAWLGCIDVASRLFPGQTIVGYEAGDDLAAATSVGFEPIGPLRVWVRLSRRA